MDIDGMHHIYNYRIDDYVCAKFISNTIENVDRINYVSRPMIYDYFCKNHNSFSDNFHLFQSMTECPDIEFLYEDADTYNAELAGNIF